MAIDAIMDEGRDAIRTAFEAPEAAGLSGRHRHLLAPPWLYLLYPARWQDNLLLC